MKLTGGGARGRRLKAGRLPGLRPSSARVREALFDILGARIRGASLLDLYAGTGAVGLEALSRGATSVLFVEVAARAVRLIEANLDRAGWGGQATVVKEDADAAVARLEGAGERFDVVFVDPPYADRFAAGSIEAAGELLREGGVLVIEHASRNPPQPDGASRLRAGRCYRYGDSALTLFHLDPTPVID